MRSSPRADAADLEARACAGSAAAFGALIRLFDDDLRGVVWSIVRSANDTDEIMQVAYEKAFRSIATFDRRSALKTWLHAICYRAALDHIRYERRRRHETLDAATEVAGAELTGATVVGRMELAAVLSTLEPEQRAMLMLTAGLGYSFDEAAEITGNRRGTVASRVSRARSRLARWESP